MFDVESGFFVGNLQQALNEYFLHILERGNAAWRCQQPPTVSSLKMSWKRRPSVAAKEEQEQRGNTHLCYFSARKYQTSSVTHTTHGECTQRCVCVCVTDLFITSDYSCLKIIQHASTTPDSFCLSIEINFPSLPTVDPSPSLTSSAARLLSCPSCGSL